jgi:hypothetical protein
VGLDAAAANISTKEELGAFIANLIADIEKNDRKQHGTDVPRYLNAMREWLKDCPITDEPRWRTLAKALLAASRHE